MVEPLPLQKRLLFIVVSLFCLICASRISITLPISEMGIPFTAQSLAVFIIAGLLRPIDFAVVLLTYLFLGIVGVPVFADGSYGWEKITGGSGGFLYGFLFAGLVISSYTANSSEKGLWRMVVIMLLGTVVMFGFGLSHLAWKYGWEKALEYGLYPFWMMGLVKAILSAIVVWGCHRILKAKIKA